MYYYSPWQPMYYFGHSMVPVGRVRSSVAPAHHHVSQQVFCHFEYCRDMAVSFHLLYCGLMYYWVDLTDLMCCVTDDECITYIVMLNVGDICRWGRDQRKRSAKTKQQVEMFSWNAMTLYLTGVGGPLFQSLDFAHNQSLTHSSWTFRFYVILQHFSHKFVFFNDYIWIYYTPMYHEQLFKQ